MFNKMMLHKPNDMMIVWRLDHMKSKSFMLNLPVLSIFFIEASIRLLVGSNEVSTSVNLSLKCLFLKSVALDGKGRDATLWFQSRSSVSGGDGTLNAGCVHVKLVCAVSVTKLVNNVCHDENQKKSYLFADEDGSQLTQRQHRDK